LSKGDVVEVKAMKKPPDGVKLTMHAVCLMMGKKGKKITDPNSGKKVMDFWEVSQKELLGDSRFLQNLIDYDKDNMDPHVMEKVVPFTENPLFTPEVVKKASVAASGLCKWVHAMVLYDKVAKVVAPKKAALAGAEKSLADAKANLAEKQAELQGVIDKLDALNTQLKAANDKKQALADQVADCEAKLTRASQLMDGLGGERVRWAQFSVDLAAEYENVTGDIMLASGVIAYLGAFTVNYRTEAVKLWSEELTNANIKCAENFSLTTTLGEPVEIRGWTIFKLPNDGFSIDNAILLHRSNRWPLMIDPQGQANRWIKNMEAANTLKIVKQNQSSFVRTIENAIQFGNPVLLENVPETIDPVLESVLLKQVVTTGGIATIKVGDNLVEYDPHFKMYITTKLRNPHYPPETCVKVNLLNFMATEEGLQDQMLGIVVAKEEPELEAQREQLVIEDAENKAQLKDIEDTILRLLKEATGNILDDEVLIETLTSSKVTSDMIGIKVKEAEKTQVVIAKARVNYTPVAYRSSQLFFCIADLMMIDPMYQYSMEWFIGLFLQAIKKAAPAKALDERLENLNNSFTFVLYNNVCRSLFEKSKLLFSFLLCMKLQTSGGLLDQSELRYFLTGSTSMDLKVPNPTAGTGDEWLSDKSWGDILGLDIIPALKGYSETFANSLDKWRAVFNADDPAQEILQLCPDADEKKGKAFPFNAFRRMMLLRAVRPDAVVPAVRMFVKDSMGQKYIEPPPFDLAASYSDSTCATPLIFVLSPGADPMSELLKLAAAEGFGGNKLSAISLGQGQGPLAKEAIEKGSDLGTWVCLQNCHLYVSWMSTLERMCEEITPETVNETFRLWLTSEPSKAFPVFVLQNGIKMVNEPPKGIRASLKGTFGKMDEEFFESCVYSKEFKKILFGLAFFHADLIERRKFGPIGWNIKYVFSTPDFNITRDQLKIFLDDRHAEDPVPYPALAYLAGQCNYGGRVTDDKDRRCIANILQDFYCESIQDDNYKFSPSGTYYVPTDGNIEHYLEYIENLPFEDGPEVFGLHANANITSAINETNMMLGEALSLQPKEAGGAGMSWDDKLAMLSSDIENRLPEQYDIPLALIKFPVRYDESMNTVLTQELGRFNILLLQMKKTLKEVQKALKGLVVMSGELEGMGNSMVDGGVPNLWSSRAYPSLKPLGGWVTDLLARLTFLQDWFDSGVTPNLYWISGFFFTQAFITGTKQNFARKHKLPIDTVDFDFAVLKQDLIAKIKDGKGPKPDDGAYVWGLFLDGGRWDADAHEMAEQKPKELFTVMPHIHLLPKPKKDILGVEDTDPGGTAHVYRCPTYKTSLRFGVLSTTGHSTNFVMWIRIPMAAEHNQQHWIKRGTAMLSSLDD
jgi:dynein heavy chain